MVTIAYLLAILFMVFLPLIFSFTLVRRYSTPWMVFGIGGLAFLVAEIVGPQVLNWLTTSEFFANATHNLPLVYMILIYALVLSVFETAARYAGFRLAGSQSNSWGGGLTLAVGFAALNLVLIFGLNALMTLVYMITAPSTIPDGMTASDFAAIQQQVGDFWNATFLNSFVQTQLIPGLAQFVLQFTITLIMWVGVVQKKWLWIFSAFLFDLAMTALYSVVGNWTLMYLVNAQDYAINLVFGCFIFVALIAFNAGIIYVIYKQVSPLAPPVVKVIPAPVATKKPATNTLAPREKAVQDVKSAKKLKNTDLK